MQSVRLTNTGLTVSKLCMGTSNFGDIGEETARRLMDGFLEAGGNFIDTAHVYCDWLKGEGHLSERIIGRWLRGKRREDVVLCTKGGHFDLANPGVSRVTPEEIKRDFKESLDCLETDYVDVYMLHRDNPALPVGEIMEALNEIVESGKARCLGCSNWTRERVEAAWEYARARGVRGFAVNELMWSRAKINRDAIPADYVTMDDKTMDMGVRLGMSFMAFSSQAGGYFAKRYQGAPVRENLRRFYDNPENEEALKEMKALKSAEEVTRACLRYFDGRKAPCVPIAAFSSMEQLRQCAGAFSQK